MEDDLTETNTEQNELAAGHLPSALGAVRPYDSGASFQETFKRLRPWEDE